MNMNLRLLTFICFSISSLVGLNLIPLSSSDAYNILWRKALEFGVPKPNKSEVCKEKTTVEEISDLAIVDCNHVYILCNSKNQSVSFGEGSYGRVVVLAVWKDTELQLQAFKYLELPIPHLLIREIDNSVFLQRSEHVPKFLGLLSIQDLLVPGFNQELAIFISKSIYVITLDDFIGSNIKYDWIDLCLRVSLALSDLHKKRHYFHGDIKPNNILVRLDDQGHVSIIFVDFGQSAPLGQATFLPFMTSYNLAYHMAPEVARGYSLSEKTDIFSLGFMFSSLGKLKSVEALRIIGEECTNESMMLRPSLDEIIERLRSIK